MKERKYVKLRTDMYADTKFKIIDMKPERDMIHYVWTRFVTLAGKVNMEGDLFMSRNLPYTIETLAIEFNRNEEQIKLAIDVFSELEMIELIEGRIYRVKNFAKHQNIKVEEKANSEDKEEEHKDLENNAVENQKATTINEEKKTLAIDNSVINKENTLSREISNSISPNSITIPFEEKKNKKAIGKKKKEEVANIADEQGEEDEMFCFREGEFIPSEGEKIIASWTF